MDKVLKYRIREILASYPPAVQRVKRAELREKLGRSPQMFTLYVNATIDKTLDFDGMELPTIANVLGVEIAELFTRVVEK
jgi:hypothetical protein